MAGDLGPRHRPGVHDRLPAWLARDLGGGFGWPKCRTMGGSSSSSSGMRITRRSINLGTLGTMKSHQQASRSTSKISTLTNDTGVDFAVIYLAHVAGNADALRPPGPPDDLLQ